MASPSGPVQALAQPLLMATTRARPPEAASRAFETSTGAACALFVVKTAAAAAGRSETISARSGLPFFFTPHAIPAARNPAGADTLPSTSESWTAPGTLATVMPGSG